MTIWQLLFPMWYTFIAIEEATEQNEPLANAQRLLVEDFINKNKKQDEYIISRSKKEV